MPTIPLQVSNEPLKTLIILLPGVRDRADDFVEEGFASSGKQADLDIIAVDAHWGYYADGSVVRRLREDVVAPALRDGYQSIWLLGVSLGGYGSILYASEYANDIDGLILLGPYPGDRDLVQDIEAAGGLANWSGGSLDAEPRDLSAWRWLKRAATSSTSVPVILGFGASDRYSTSYVPLVQALDPSRVYIVDGSHNWTTWSLLWNVISADGHIE